MTEVHTNNSVGFGFIDLLLLIAENVRSILLVALLAGAIGAAYRYSVPASFESVTIVKGAAAATPVLVTSPTLLVPVVRELGLEKGRAVGDAVEDLRGRIRVAFNPREEMATISVRWHTNEGAQRVAMAVWRRLALHSGPQGSEKAKLEQQLRDVQTRSAEVSAAINLLRGRLEQPSSPGGAEVAQGYALLIQTARTLATESARLEKQLLGLDDSALVQPPTLPVRPVGAGVWLVGAVAALVGGIGYTVLLLLKGWLAHVFSDQESTEKLRRVRNALRSF